MITQIKSDWKSWLKTTAIYTGIFLLGAMIGTTLEGIDILKQIFINVVTNVTSPWVIIAIIAYIGLRKEVHEFFKSLPSLLDRYERIKLNAQRVQWAKTGPK